MKIESVAVAGLGNIGSPLVDHLSRFRELKRLILIDDDIYKEENLAGQSVFRSDVGRYKAAALADRVRAIRADIEVIPHVCRFEELPLGAVEGSVICACLDSRQSRVFVNEAATRLGIPWIDAGVLASESLVRVEVYAPGPDAPCFECGFSRAHYETMEVKHACHGRLGTAPTNAPAFLGSLAASLQANECQTILNGRAEGSLAGKQLVFSLDTRQCVVTRLTRNPDCLFDHEVYAPAYSDDSSVGDLAATHGGRSVVFFRAPGKAFAKPRNCSKCGCADERVRCVSNLDSPTWRCNSCGEPNVFHPADLRNRVLLSDLPKAQHSESPLALGLRPGDLFSIISPKGDHHYLAGRRSGPVVVEEKL